MWPPTNATSVSNLVSVNITLGVLIGKTRSYIPVSSHADGTRVVEASRGQPPEGAVVFYGRADARDDTRPRAGEGRGAVKEPCG